MDADALREAVEAADDRRFDQVFPHAIRMVSARHWTPVEVARRAARFLSGGRGDRILDIGCGPGKFCLVGALTTRARFHGIDRREQLTQIAHATARKAGIGGVTFAHRDVTSVGFEDFDAFYLFNSFAENLGEAPPIDRSVALSPLHYDQFTQHVHRQLTLASLGTRVATYWGRCDEIPEGFSCMADPVFPQLRLWEKVCFEPTAVAG